MWRYSSSHKNNLTVNFSTENKTKEWWQICFNIPRLRQRSSLPFRKPKGDALYFEDIRYSFNGTPSLWVHYLNSSWFLGCNGERLQQDQYIRKMKELFTFFRSQLIFPRNFFLRVSVTILEALMLVYGDWLFAWFFSFRKRKRKVRKNRACPFRQIQIPIVDLVNSLLKRILVLTEHETGQTTEGYIPLHKFNRNSLLSLFTHSAPTPLFE